MRTVNLDANEKQKLLSYVASKQKAFHQRTSARQTEITRLNSGLKTVHDEFGARGQKSDVKRLEEHIKTRIKSIEQDCVLMAKEAQLVQGVYDALSAGKVFKGSSDLFGDIYREELTKDARVSAKFNCYPRLKKAMESSKNVFANKIKILMENENVKVA